MRKVENGKGKEENEKWKGEKHRTKTGFLKTTDFFFFLRSTKMEISTRKKQKSHQEESEKGDFPTAKYSRSAPGYIHVVVGFPYYCINCFSFQTSISHIWDLKYNS